MYRYNSVQTHTQFVNGKSQTKTNRVSINGKTGYKMITVRNNKGTKKKKKKLRNLSQIIKHYQSKQMTLYNLIRSGVMKKILKLS